MKLHRNAALSLKKRELLVSRVVDEGWSLTKAAEAAEVSERTAGKWVCRFEAEGAAGLLDRSSAPRHVHNRTEERRIQVIAALRRLRMTGAEIAEVLGMPQTTVSGVLKRIGMGKRGRLGLEPAQRYERGRPGELVHVDVKKLGRIPDGRAGHRIHGNRGLQRNPRKRDAAGRDRRQVGWEYVHVCVDDATRLAYVEVLADERAKTAIGFLGRAVRFFRRHGIRVERVLTDNGGAYRSTVHAFACRILGLKHLRTRPYRPQTNGKAERFIRTMLGGWAYGAIYGSSAERTAALDGWLWRYNHERPHGSLGRKPPSARLTELNNLLGAYI
jgi:transposase InsO family protein